MICPRLRAGGEMLGSPKRPHTNLFEQEECEHRQQPPQRLKLRAGVIRLRRTKRMLLTCSYGMKHELLSTQQG